MRTIVLVVALCWSVWGHTSAYEEAVEESMQALGKPVEHIDVQLLSGQQVSMSSLNGNPSVIYFFASWCAPCYASLRNIETVRKQHNLSVNFIAMALDDDTSAVHQMLEKTGFEGEVWQAVGGVKPLTERKFANSVKALPYLIKLNEQGVLVEQSYNIKSVGQWRRVLVDNMPLQDALVDSE